MQELDLGSFQDVERYSGSDSALSRLMCNMKDLLGLSCGPHILDAAAIEHLSSLPRLRKLHLPHDSQEILQGLNRKRHALRNPQPFPELQDLFIRESKLSSFTLLTKYMRPLQIRDLTLQLSNTFNARDIMQSFSALSEGSSQYGNIQKLTHKYIWLVNEPGTRTVNKEVVIGGDIMHPLLTLTNLTVLELDILCAFNLGDPEIMLMADTWTSAAGILVGMEDFSCISYSGFLHLLLKCPELEYLAFVFDASSNIPDPSIITADHINKNIPYLFVGNSRIGTNDSASIGKFFWLLYYQIVAGSEESGH